jgi:glycosyltransferase involved in cell wall biosynthesis
VYPGVDFSEYATVELGAKRLWFHFLGNASKRGRNVRGAIDLAAQVNARLHVIGGSRINFRQGISIPLSTAARFHGTLSPGGRDALLNTSKGLVFPVLWPEPFSLSIIESLYFGCPMFGTPFGALPEILGKKITHKDHALTTSGTVDAFYSDYGCLSTKKAELVEALKNSDDFDRAKCHTYALESFSSQRMAQDYLRLYEQVLNGKQLHPTAPEMSETPSDKLFSIQ